MVAKIKNIVKDVKWAFGHYFRCLSLDAWLFLALSSYALYRTTNRIYEWNIIYYWLLPGLVLSISLYLYYEIKGRKQRNNDLKIIEKKTGIIIFSVMVFLIGYFFNTIENHKHPISLFTHDEIIVTEKAMQYMVEGKNPYFEEYYDSDLIKHSPEKKMKVMEDLYVFNPAFVTYAYFPGQFLISLPFYLIVKNFFHWYDHRLFYLLCMFLILMVAYRLVRRPYLRLLFLICFFFYIDFLMYFYYGWNDLLVLLFLLLSFYLLKNKKIYCSVIFLALAVACKQTALVIIPFYFLFLYQDKRFNFKKIIKKIICPGLLLVIVSFSIILPFFFWQRDAFVEDVLEYQTGRSENSYPINGFGFSRLIYILRAVDSVNDYYPFSVWQIIFVVPLTFFLLIKQFRDNSLKRMILNYTLVLFIVWFFSRSFLGTHMAYTVALLPIAYFIEE